jgi:hypothetical protein
VQHQFIYYSEISEAKLKFGIAKAMIQFQLRKHLGGVAPVLVAPFEAATDLAFRLL